MMNVIKRKKVMLLGVFFIFCFFALGNMIIVSAHSPSSMSLQYQMDSEQLLVSISHQVANPNTHYVDNIVITRNEETVVNQDYTSQQNSSFSYTFSNFTAVKDDAIEVTASCNQGGSISETIIIGSDDGSGTDSDSTPGFMILMLLAALSMVILLKKRK